MLSGIGGNLLALAGVLGVTGLLIFFLLKTAKKQGHAEGVIVATEKHNEAVNQHNEVVAEENRQIVEEVEKTHETHDRLDSDPAYRQRVRDRFTRPD